MAEYEVAVTDTEIRKQEDLCRHGGPSRWPGMSYEDGVRQTLDWVFGNDDDPPMAD